MKVIIREAFGYTIASAIAFGVDFAILFVLVHFFRWWYLAAATVSFSAGVGVAYIISVGLVFKERRLQDRRLEFATFTAIGAIGLAINASTMFVAVRYFGLNYLIAKGVAAGFTFLTNFIVRRQFLFAHASTA